MDYKTYNNGCTEIRHISVFFVQDKTKKRKGANQNEITISIRFS
jgi:hypothetical protein